MNRTIRYTRLACCGFALGCFFTVASAVASPLAPKKPSDLVTLARGDSCDPNPIGRKVDQLQNSDGTLLPFSIPPGKVLVVTGIDWTQGNTGAPNKAEILFLHSQTASGVINPMVTSHDNGSADGRAGASIPVTGVTFKSGETLCVSANTGNIGSLGVRVHGFLAKDR